ncbi:MAG: response regulator [Chloroflexi bacterium]|nr:response regulator [Chloroflexota bacterium]
MNKEPGLNTPELQQAFSEYDRRERLTNAKVACALVVVLMPAGFTLDWFVYPEQVTFFLQLRFLCSLIVGVVWFLLRTPFGLKHYRILGMGWYFFSSFFISWMIASTEGAISPYYAGINLVLLAVSSVIHGTLWESILVFGVLMTLYLGACFLHFLNTPVLETQGIFFNNLYFLVLTAIIVITGNYFFNRLRVREFVLRYELKKKEEELARSNDKLVEMARLKNEFFANISHELRTPLTLLLAPLESLLNNKSFSLDAEIRDLLDTMYANGMRLLKLINDLLDLVKLESHAMEVKKEPLALPGFVKGLASSVRKVAEDRHLLLTTALGAGIETILADHDKLERIILNLLFNSLKFTPAGGRVELLVEKQEADLVIKVTDTGMGIAEKQLPFIFDRFWQADSSARRKYQGTGIGLALVKELVEVQGGQVSAESREGKGTTILVRIPFRPADQAALAGPVEKTEPAPAAAAPAPGEEAAPQENEWLASLYRRAELFPAMTPLQETLRPVETTRDRKRFSVLVADDEPDMLRFLKSQLGGHFQVFEAVDGAQALDKASQFLPDIILLDMMMPEKDGLQVCRELRQRTPTQNIPVVLLTARADEETKLAALAAGASDFLTKPFSTTELHVRLKNLIDSHRLQKELARKNKILEATLDDLKETESQLVQSEKLASLGRLSAGIIHEINNPLNFAKTGLYILRGKGQSLGAAERPEFEDILRDVEEGIDRVKNIVTDLKTFTHPNPEEVEEVEVQQIVSSALRFLSHEWKDQVEIHQQIPEGQTVWGNQNQITQVMLNLLQNSLDALKGKKPGPESPGIWIEGRVEAEKSLVIVRDNGAGISRHNLDKIFDPFFTTKDVGEGMGLGLSICYRIIQEHGGKIVVRSEEGKFCEFTLEFPLKMPEYAK